MHAAHSDAVRRRRADRERHPPLSTAAPRRPTPARRSLHDADVDFLGWLRVVGGVCTVVAAREHASSDELRRLRARGALWVPLRGWVALAEGHGDVTRALQLGGVATCVSALRRHGLWTPHGDSDLHVRVPRATRTARVAGADALEDVRVHRLHERLPEERPWDGVDGIRTALAVASGCVGADDLLAAAESALQQGRLQREALLELAAKIPRRCRVVLERASALSGSGSESTFAAMLRRAHIRFVQQAELLPGEFFDFLIGTSLVVEVDSLEWHGSRAQMARDRARDARLTALGYRVVRFTYEQVMFERESVLQTVLDLVRRDMHERKVRR